MSQGLKWTRSDGTEIEVREMNDFHLVAAHNKLAKKLHEGPLVGSPEELRDALVLALLKAELRDRDLDPQYKGGRPPDVPPIEGGEAGDHWT